MTKLTDVRLESLIASVLDDQRAGGATRCEACGEITDEPTGPDGLLLCRPCHRRRQELTGVPRLWRGLAGRSTTARVAAVVQEDGW